MSILRKPYEISVWDDVWSTDKFIEQRLGIIGSDKMQSQSRVIEPELTQNVNGTKKFSFKLYKRYKDNITGELVENPFYNWLANERKVKLNYDGTWYDFVIKNISEPSSNYLYTYQLEDANVQELSKNGFNFIFDPELQNNLGTSQELANDLLAETDWTVGNCDVPVQTIDEALVYLIITKEDGINATQIIDPVKDEKGVEQGVTFETFTVLDNGEKVPITLPAGTVVLAAYSSCTGRPHRFQFFWVDGMIDNEGNITNKLTVDDNRFIKNDNCQYYIDFDDPEVAYWEKNNYIIPKGFYTTTVAEYPGDAGVTLSSEFRGKRYGFTQQTQYIPGLERYVNLYKDKDDENKIYYGYEHTEYLSPILVQNLISGSQLKSTSGWVGTTTVSGGNKATVEAVYGKNPGASFVSSLKDIANGQYNENNDYAPYIKITFPNDGSGIVVNSGPHDNRRLIGNMEVGDQYKIDCDYTSTDSSAPLSFKLCECVYSPDGKYNYITDKIRFSELDENGIVTVNYSDYSKEGFTKNSEVRLCIYGTPGVSYYIEKISLYKVAYYKDLQGNSQIITPDLEISTDVNNNTVDTTYYYIDASTTPTSPDSVIPTTITKTLTYDTYKPVYNTGGCKVRTVTAKESNYFNILQSIAETFGQWLEINVVHDDDGTRLSKSVAFRNYVGHNNYAGFKYGVNLKDIKRTYESKKLVTKLIVKQNSNEFAPNGFCTIARADANPTGENTIYDFQYFFNTGMMSARDYLETTYVVYNKNLDGIQGYFPRIRDLNIQIQKDNDTLLNLSKDLVQISAELEVATVGAKAALDGIEETDEQIRFLTGYNIVGLNNYLSSIKGNDKLTDEQKKQELEILNRSDVKKAIQEYSVYKSELKKYEEDKTRLEQSKATIEDKYSEIDSRINDNTASKEALHKEFFATYCRFIQEGTWISEDYVNDEKYYADALSVLYNSCYPKVAYDVNVIEISKLRGYENYAYNLGDITFVEDKEFFGEDFRVEVSVTETTDNLDDPSKNKIKVQNFKDQFQDLFQKITATVQQTQYNTGSYEKAVALAEAGQERKQQFLTDALDGMSSRLAVAGQQTVVIDSSGITVTDDDTPSESIRMVGGAVMLSKQDANGETKWTTGLTSDGMSASLITAGVINAGQIAIMNSDQPTFRWDSYGISAFETTWHEGVISGFDNSKFVRFDKNGIYGINGTVNGLNWHPTKGADTSELDDINSKATFALTWDGLKVTGNNATTWIGKHDIKDKDGKILASKMIRVTDKSGNETFSVNDEGDVLIRGNLSIGDGTSIEDYVGTNISEAETALQEEINGAKDLINEIEGNLQSQIDGEITTWFYGGEPSLENAPAENWKDEENKQKHIDDLYYDTNTQYVYRWVKYEENEENRFKWVKITDKGIQDALEAASTAQSTADGKRRIFTGVPTVPYDVGDLWVNATHEGKYTNELLRCNSPKGSDAEFSIDDWEKASKYTDDTVANSKMNPSVDTANFSWEFNQDDGMYMYTGNQKPENAVFKIYEDKQDNNYKLWIRGNGEFTGTITANGGEIGGCKITNGKLEVSAANIKDKLTADQIEVSALKVGLITFGDSGEYYINPNGFTDKNYPYIVKLPCFEIMNDYTTGSPYNTICGWNLSEDSLYRLTGEGGSYQVGIYGGTPSSSYKEYYTNQSLITDKQEIIRFYAGPYETLQINNAYFQVLSDGTMYASAVKLGTGGLGSDESIFLSTADMEGKKGFFDGTQIDNWRMTVGSNFGVTSDGSLYASAAKIEGNITASTGKIGNWSISSGYLTSTITVNNNMEWGDYIGKVLQTTYLKTDMLRSYYHKPLAYNPNTLASYEVHWLWIAMAGYEQYINYSDFRLKNSIRDYDNQIEEFFDALKPRRYRYNDTSHSRRDHFGFIAQEVVEALSSAELTSNDFAGVSLDGYGTEEPGYWYLRRDEFVSLNTWQIQKLKTRVTELENKLNSLLQGENTNETINNI